jgi:hypothetical protein
MGREIRRVPPGWEHPRYGPGRGRGRRKRGGDREGQLRPCGDEDYETAARRWIEEFEQWQHGTHPSQPCEYAKYYWDYANTPDEDTCRPAFKEEPTHYQIYENVSEGTPVSPVFENLDQLKQWLVAMGYSEESAAGFAEDGFAVSFVVTPGVGVEDGISHARVRPKKPGG